MSEEQIVEQQPEPSAEDKALAFAEQAFSEEIKSDDATPVEETETPAETTAETEKPTNGSAEKDPVDERSEKLFAEMDRREASLRKREQVLEGQFAELSKPQVDPYVEKIRKLLDNAKNDPDALLSAAGLDYDKLTDFKLNGGRPAADQIEEIRKENQQFRQEIETRQKQEAEEKQKANNEKQYQEYWTTLDNFVKEGNYPFISHYGDSALSAIIQMSTNHYVQSVQDGNPTHLSFEELCQTAETEYKKDAEQRYKFFQEQFSSDNEPKTVQDEPKVTPKAEPTLSNRDTVHSSTVPKEPANEEERLAKAAKILNDGFWEGDTN